MSHMHWVARQNKLELPNDEEEVNTPGLGPGPKKYHYFFI